MFDRLQPRLPELIDELAAAAVPDYFDDLLQTTSSARQRPAWSPLGRWSTMADLTTRPALVPSLPWRQLAVALLIIALGVAGVAAVLSARGPELPPPFGVARNGQVAFARGGDIHLVDPVTGVETTVVSGPETHVGPEFSLDGTKLAFVRRHDAGERPTFDLIVADADGSDLRVVSTEPLAYDSATVWATDGTWILVGDHDGRVVRYDTTGKTPPLDIAERGRLIGPEALQPPDGDHVLFEPDRTDGIDLWLMAADGSRMTPVLPVGALSGSERDLQEYRWSPDGTKIAYACGAPTRLDIAHICVVNADGTGSRQLTDEPDSTFQADFRWSPDGRSVAFNRWAEDPLTGQVSVLPIGIVSVAGGPVRDLGPTPASEGALFDFSPDGTTVLSLPARLAGTADPEAAPAAPLVIDVATGNATTADWQVNSGVSWQRLAP
jgi:Tol biopolymer transport system component